MKSPSTTSGSATPEVSRKPTSGRIHFWVGDGSEYFPDMVPVETCGTCGALVLAATAAVHAAWHRTGGV